MKILVTFASMSGNTLRVAKDIGAYLGGGEGGGGGGDGGGDFAGGDGRGSGGAVVGGCGGARNGGSVVGGGGSNGGVGDGSGGDESGGGVGDHSTSRKVRVLDLFDASPTDFVGYDLILFGCSTFEEEGLNPIATRFLEERCIEENCLFDYKFAIFALGDSSYKLFAPCGNITKTKIESFGGVVVGEILTIDGYPDDKVLAEAKKWADEIVNERVGE